VSPLAAITVSHEDKIPKVYANPQLFVRLTHGGLLRTLARLDPTTRKYEVGAPVAHTFDQGHPPVLHDNDGGAHPHILKIP
jgi:hypothetical protein